jgi:hypothetical protein
MVRVFVAFWMMACGRSGTPVGPGARDGAAVGQDAEAISADAMPEAMPDGASDACTAPDGNSAAPFVFDPAQEMVGNRETRIAAAAGDRVAVLTNRPPDLLYLESLDGGATFRPPLKVDVIHSNLLLSFGGGFVYVAYSDLGLVREQPAGVARAPLAPGGVSAFPPFTRLGGNNAGLLEVVPGPQRRLAIIAANASAVPREEGLYVFGSDDAGETFRGPTRVEPFAPCARGVFDDTGRFYLIHVAGYATGWVITLRFSDDLGAAFSQPYVTKSMGSMLDCPRVFVPPSGDVVIVTAHGPLAGPNGWLAVDRFSRAMTSWGPRTVVVGDAPNGCWDAALLSDGRVVVTSAPATTGTDHTLHLSVDEGRSFVMRQPVPVLSRQDYCPQLAGDRNLYLTWSRGPGSWAFARASQPRACR